MPGKESDYKLVYILGSSHCGSTLIDMAIGTSKEAFSMGELAFYSHYLEKIPHKKIDSKRGFVCTCGKQVVDCPFWKTVKRKVKDGTPIIKNRGHIETYKIFYNLLVPFKKARFPIRISKNKEVLDAVYRTASKNKKQLRYLVDSSKDPRRLYELIKDISIPMKNIYVLYLVREGSAYLNSYKKDVATISGVGNRSMFVTLMEWLGVHIASRRLLKNYNLKCIIIKYHDFAQNPGEVMNEIRSFLQLEGEKNTESYLKSINRSTYHNLHGNFVKFKKFERIFYDTAWKENLNWYEKLVSSIILYPFNRFWVYGTDDKA